MGRHRLPIQATHHQAHGHRSHRERGKGRNSRRHHQDEEIVPDTAFRSHGHHREHAARHEGEAGGVEEGLWEDGERYKVDWLARAFKEFPKKNNLRVIRFHDLRHTCARMLRHAEMRWRSPLTIAYKISENNYEGEVPGVERDARRSTIGLNVN